MAPTPSERTRFRLDAIVDGVEVSALRLVTYHGLDEYTQETAVIAAFAPGATVSSIAVETSLGVLSLPFPARVQHFTLATATQAQDRWVIADTPPTSSSLPGGYTFSVCLDGVVYATSPGPIVPTRAAEALPALAKLTRAGWRPHRDRQGF
jgi:hypothetical protein